MTNKKHITKISKARERAHDNVDSILDKTESVAKRSKEMIVHQKDKVMSIRDDINEYIRENPKRSIILAAGMGYILAKVITRKRR